MNRRAHEFDFDELFERSQAKPCPKCPHGELPVRRWQASGSLTEDGKRKWFSSERRRKAGATSNANGPRQYTARTVHSA